MTHVTLVRELGNFDQRPQLWSYPRRLAGVRARWRLNEWAIGHHSLAQFLQQRLQCRLAETGTDATRVAGSS